jgi:hypothetical protein
MAYWMFGLSWSMNDRLAWIAAFLDNMLSLWLTEGVHAILHTGSMKPRSAWNRPVCIAQGHVAAGVQHSAQAIFYDNNSIY